MPAQARDFSIFDVRLCYASEDENYQKEFDKHLATLRRQGLDIEPCDCKVNPGVHRAITSVGQKVGITLLLLSKEFLSSSCYDIEVRQALARHQSDKTRVIPVQLSPVDIEGDPLEALQSLPINPANQEPKPITLWEDRDEAFICVIKGLRRSLDDFIRKTLTCFARVFTTLSMQYAPYWHVPHARSSVFTGRDTLLTQLHDAFRTNRAAVPWKQAITGMSGVGKTELALEYAYRYASEYQAVLWLQADSQDRLNSDLIYIARSLKLPGGEEEDRQVSLSSVQQWLRDHSPWLLILDNVKQIGDLDSLIPSDNYGNVLITTHEQVMSPAVHLLELKEMQGDEAALLLLRRAGILKEHSLASVSAADRAQARKIARRLGKLPLAIDQAGAYLEETKTSLTDYLTLYGQQHSQLLKRRGRRPRAHPDSVTMTLLLCFEQLKQKNAAAAELLQFCAFFHSGVIPEDLIRDADDSGFVLQSLIADMAALDGALEDLLNWSLIGYNAKTRDLSVHPLVQDVLQDTMDDTTRRVWAQRAIHAVNRAFPNAEVEVWPICQQYLPHALKCFDWIDQWQIATADGAELFNRIGRYFYQRTQYDEAESYYKRAWSICERGLGSDHPITALTLHNQGALVRSRGQDYPQSRRYYEQALAIRERVLGPHDPAIAQTLNGLGELDQTVGAYVRAESSYQRAWTIIVQAFGVNDPNTATCLSNLAGIFDAHGHYQQAEQYYQQALAIQEQRLGENESRTIETTRNLAGLYRRMKKYREAEQLYEQALLIMRRKYGPEHHKVAGTLNNMAVLYRDQGRYAEAEQMLNEALDIWRKRLGEPHRDTSFGLNNLATIYSARQEYARAKPLYLQALAIREHAYDKPDHPDIAQVLNNLGKDYIAQGRYSEAEPLLQRAFAIYEKGLGLDHPDTTACRQNLAMLPRTKDDDAQVE